MNTHVQCPRQTSSQREREGERESNERNASVPPALALAAPRRRPRQQHAAPGGTAATARGRRKPMPFAHESCSHTLSTQRMKETNMRRTNRKHAEDLMKEMRMKTNTNRETKKEGHLTQRREKTGIETIPSKGQATHARGQHSTRVQPPARLSIGSTRLTQPRRTPRRTPAPSQQRQSAEQWWQRRARSTRSASR